MQECVALVIQAGCGLRVLAQQFGQYIGVAVLAAEVAGCLFGELSGHLHVQLAVLQTIRLHLRDVNGPLVLLALRDET